MSIFVDKLHPVGKKSKLKFLKTCRMYSDSISELKQFALKLDIDLGHMRQRAVRHDNSAWENREESRSHFELTAPQRRKAVELGAVEIDAGQAFKLRHGCTIMEMAGLQKRTSDPFRLE